MDEHGAHTEEMSTSVQSDHSDCDHEDSPPCMDFGQSDLDSDTESTDNTEPSPVITYEDECDELSGTVNPFNVLPRQFVHCATESYNCDHIKAHIVVFVHVHSSAHINASLELSEWYSTTLPLFRENIASFLSINVK